jgi:hypothetical protein
MSEKLKQLLKRLSDDERLLLETQFLAPCVRGGRLRARMRGLIYTFAARPRDFEGWGIFLAVSEKEAKLLEKADLPRVTRYLKLLRPIRARLAFQLSGRTWLAYPANESDAMQRVAAARPFPLHLVADGVQFESVISRYDGGGFWFEDIDRSADPLIAEMLREELRKETLPARLRFKMLTPEMRTVYELAFQQTAEFRRVLKQRREENRLKEALEIAGGTLGKFRDRGTYWTVEWTTSAGERQTSAILKSDLTVISSGICLSGRDRDFDLTSLVGVIEARDEWY